MKRALTLMLVAVLVAAPYLPFGIPGVSSGALRTPGSLQVLAIAILFGALAVSYDVIFGYTGLLSFGHALPFALGVYGTNLLMLKAGIPFALAGLLALIGNLVIAALLGAVALRTSGVAFAMVTLAFAEAFAVLVSNDPFHTLGGEEGLAIASDLVPGFLRGVRNTRNLYWLALGVAIVVFLVAWRGVGSRAGRVWQAIRESEARVEAIGLRPFTFKLVSFTLASGLASLVGSAYLVLVRGANPGVTTADFTLTLLVMVVLGGPGRLWGAALGGFVYGILTLRLGAVSTSSAIASLPHWLSGPLGEPLFVLGVLFMLLVLFAPGGLAGIVDRLRVRRTR